MRVIAGLGNPGREYADTRHNAGFLLADALASRWKLGRFRRAPHARATKGVVAGHPLTLIKPQTYMNQSGAALAPLLAQPDFHPAHDLLVLVDDAALPLGAFRLRAGGSAGGHHGLESIEATLQARSYGRLRIGVGPVSPDVVELADFVLAPFTRAEARQLEALLPVLGDAAECWVSEGIERAMNRFNRR